MNKVLLSAFIVSQIIFSSCKQGGTIVNNNGENIKHSDSKNRINPVDVTPSDYVFKNPKGESTVSFGGQSARLAMASQIKNALGNPQTSLDILNKMFKDGKGFENSSEVLDINRSGKKIRSTIASGKASTFPSADSDELRTSMDNLLKSFTEINFTEKAEKGKSGYLKNSTETKTSYLLANGVEVNQVFAKIVIGSVCLDQAINKYISEEGLKSDVADLRLKEGKPYTNLEHHWDEAYGYVFGTYNGGTLLLGKYLAKVDKFSKFSGIKERVKRSFIEGRTAASNADYSTMYAKAAELRKDLSTVVAVKLAGYLASINKEDMRDKFHGLSEAYGFAHALYFAHVNGKQVDKSKVDVIVNELKKGLYSLTSSKALELQQIVTSLFDFSAEDIDAVIEITAINPVATIPTDYTFFNKAGKSTVNFDGQNTRLAMAAQLKNAANNPEISLAQLKGMFANGTGFENSSEITDINGSGKKLRATVASGKASTFPSADVELLRSKIDGWLEEFTKIDETKKATDGISGKVMNTDGKKYALLTPKGFEVNQAVAKTIIGSVCLDQIVNKYISDERLKDDVVNLQIKKDKEYTNLEHHWDEAYGYVFGTYNDSKVLLGKYLKSVNTLVKFDGIQDRVKQNFIKGRAAASNMQYDKMYQCAAAIRKDLSTVVAVKLVHYLGSVSKTELRDKFHGLSEGYGFAHALYFAHVNGKQIDKSKVDMIVNELDKGLWKLTPSKAAELQKKVADLFMFKVSDSNLKRQ